MARFSMTDLGEVSLILGMKITRDRSKRTKANTPHQPNGLHAPGSVQHEGLQPGKYTKYGS